MKLAPLIILGSISKVYAQQFTADQCDLTLASSLCLEGGKKVLVADAVPEGMVSRWTFDDSIGLDTSGNQNHLETLPRYVTGLNGIGAAASFVKGNHITVPHSDVFGSNMEFSYTMWVNIIQTPTGNSPVFCPIVHKGEREKTTKSPQISLHSKSRTLKVMLTTDDTSMPEGEVLMSHSKLAMNRWVHISITYDKEGSLKLYVNGILDNSKSTSGSLKVNKGPLHIGGVAWMDEECEMNIVMDEFKIYNHVLSTNFIQAEAFPALSGIEPSFVSLGCVDCTFDDAQSACKDIAGYHVCTPIDLHTGGYVVARVNGYIDYDTIIFPNDYSGDAGTTGLGLCCRDY